MEVNFLLVGCSTRGSHPPIIPNNALLHMLPVLTMETRQQLSLFPVAMAIHCHIPLQFAYSLAHYLPIRRLATNLVAASFAGVDMATVGSGRVQH